MTPEELAALIRDIVTDLVNTGTVALDLASIPPSLTVERPRQREHGDWACNVAMQLGKKAGLAPRQLAELIVARLQEAPGVDAADIAGPGFINIRLSAAAAGELVRSILTAGPTYGHNKNLANEHINLEYVSANPTGPVHLGGGRWAAVGDSLARIFKACGAKVTREYYFNDHGIQIDRFAISLLAAAQGKDAPEDGYGGDYIKEIAQKVIDLELASGHADPRDLADGDAQEVFRSRGVDLMFTEIKEQLHNFGADFDVFFHENSLHESGAVDQAIATLRSKDAIADRDGAIWLLTTKYGDDKDRVLIKSDGNAAYFAADTAYYLDKRSRGATCCIYLLGADHHGYVGRLQAMCAAYGDTPYENLQVLIGQFVNLLKDGEPVRMSKRAGNVVTLDDLVDAVGVDAARYALARASMDSAVDMDLDVLSSHTNENPVYYVQYAYARTRNVTRNAAEHGVLRGDDYNPGALDHPADAQLLGVLAQFPETVNLAAATREQHRIARYLESLAATYHAWYGQCRVTPRGEDPVDDGHVARLWLNDAVTQVLGNGLALLGVSAPERM